MLFAGLLILIGVILLLVWLTEGVKYHASQYGDDGRNWWSPSGDRIGIVFHYFLNQLAESLADCDSI